MQQAAPIVRHAHDLAIQRANCLHACNFARRQPVCCPPACATLTHAHLLAGSSRSRSSLCRLSNRGPRGKGVRRHLAAYRVRRQLHRIGAVPPACGCAPFSILQLLACCGNVCVREAASTQLPGCWESARARARALLSDPPLPMPPSHAPCSRVHRGALLFTGCCRASCGRPCSSPLF